MGIDYGLGQTNIDKRNGIRYGVISVNDVCQTWYDSSEGYYGDPHCPKCGNAVSDESEVEGSDSWPQYSRGGCADYVCETCEHLLDSSDVTPDEAISHFIDDNEYKAECGDSGDIFVMKSPYYTYAPFCSPCAPGACHLGNAGEAEYTDDDGEKTYCFGHDWFEDCKAPYKVYSVETGIEVLPETVNA